MPRFDVPFSYGKPADLALTALRRRHTGSINDYAAFAAAGFVLCAFVLI